MPIAAETRHLSLLVAIDEEGSLVAAAKKLRLTPSALSQQLRELEERLGGALFSREWRRLTPTAAGRRLIESAHAVVSELTRGEQETRALMRGASATIRIASVCQQSYRWLPAVLERFAAAAPAVEVTVVVEAASAPADWLVKRQLDVALVAGSEIVDTRVATARLFRDELVAVVGRRHPWFGRRRVDAAAFATAHLFSDAGALERSAPLGRALAEAGEVTPGKVTLVPTAGSLGVDMARASLGIALLPRWTLESMADESLGAVRVGSRGLWLTWSLATRSETPEPALRTFLETLRAHHPRAAKPIGRRRR